LNTTTAELSKTSSALLPFLTVEEAALVSLRNTRGRRKEKHAAKAFLDQLTRREREVLGFVIAGRINREIAAELGTTEKTIKNQRVHLMKKLKAGSVAELVHLSLQSRLKPASP